MSSLQSVNKNNKEIRYSFRVWNLKWGTFSHRTASIEIKKESYFLISSLNPGLGTSQNKKSISLTLALGVSFLDTGFENHTIFNYDLSNQ